MIRYLGRMLGTLALVFGSTVVFILVHTLLPFPYNQINSIFIIVLFLIFFTRLSFVLWFILISGYLLELYSIHPFGVVLGSMLFSTLIGFFFFQRFLNLFSLASFFVLLLVLILINRISIWVLIFFTEQGVAVFNLKSDLLHLFWEFFMSSIVFFILYAIVHYNYKGTRPEYIRV